MNFLADGAQTEPMLDGGRFAAVWTTEDETKDGSGHAIKAQVFNASGEKIGTEFRVNTEGTGGKTAPSVSRIDTGFAVSWATDDSTQDGDGRAIKMQHFAQSLLPDPVLDVNEISETAIGGLRVGTFSTNSLNQEGFSYGLVSDPSGAFNLIKKTLVLKDPTKLDFESMP